MKAILPTLFVCLYSASLLAQSVVGSGVVRGRVVDQYGEGMPDVELSLDNSAMGITRNLESSTDGVFEIAGLPPATGYRLRVTHKRYLDWESKEFEVLAGKQSSFEVTMQPQEGTGGGKAGAATHPVDNTTSPIGAVVSTRQIELLPAVKRRWDSLVWLSPVTNPSTLLGVPAIHGDVASNAYFTDGLLTVNGYSGRRSVPAGPVAQDAVQGMEILAGAAPVEFGHAKGGAINVVTRSGGSQLHGGVYEYFSNDSLNAVDRYALGNNLFGKRNQLGFNLGGNIPHTKLFFFSNMEISDGHGQRLNRITNPLIADSTGMHVASSNCKATAAQCAAAASFIEKQMNVLVPRSEHGISGLTKLDYRFSDRNIFSLSAYATHSRGPLEAQSGAVSTNGGLLGNGYSKQDTHYGKFEWISTPMPSSSNELRLGLFQDRIAIIPSSSSPSTGSVGINLAGTTIGATNVDRGILRERRYQFVDNFRMSVGTHTFMVGADLTRTRDWVNMLSNSKGTYYYSTLTAFAQDLSGSGRKNYTEFTQSLRDPVRRLPSSEMGFYVQDVWRVSPRLQVTGGVRWSKPSLPQPTVYDTSYYQTRTVKSPSNNADPRLGLAYLLNDRTVVRASFGMFHAPHSGELMDALFLGNGAYQPSLLVNPTQTTVPLFPSILTSKTAPSGTGNLMYASGKPKNPYTSQTTLSLERYLGAGLTLNASYVGIRGLKLWTAEEVNLATTSKTVTYTINDANGNKAGSYETLFWRTRLDSTRAHVYQVTNGGSSWYRAMVVQLGKRMGHGFSAQASYTWSHAIDDVGGTLVTGALPVGSYGNAFRFDQGSSSTDQRHRAVFDWTWQPRLIKSESPFARYLANGWELSSITTMASSQPSTPLVVVIGQQFSGVASAFPGSLTGAGGWSRVPFLPVNNLNADPEYTVNARLARPLPFTERITGRLVFEAFNLLNSQFNTGVNTIAYTATGGVLTPVSGLGAGNASRGYISGSNARSCQVAFRLSF